MKSRVPLFLIFGVIFSGLCFNIANSLLLSQPNSEPVYSTRIHDISAMTLTPNFKVVPKKGMGGADDVRGSDDSLSSNLPMGLETDHHHEHIARGIDSYTVQPGDTLTQIAEDYRVSVNTIRWENGISGNKLSTGQELIILPVSGVRHTIKKGDTFGSIAKKYRVDTDDILIYNQIKKDELLIVGEKIMVPNGVIVNRNRVTAKKTYYAQKTDLSSGYYARPTNGPLTSAYGPRWGGFHYGDDYGVPIGSPIIAAASGVVSKVRHGWGGGYGNYIIIKHGNGTETLYAHLSKTNVVVGQRVRRGERIASSGNTGRSTGPHLHWEVIDSSTGQKLRPPRF